LIQDGPKHYGHSSVGQWQSLDSIRTWWSSTTTWRSFLNRWVLTETFEFSGRFSGRMFFLASDPAGSTLCGDPDRACSSERRTESLYQLSGFSHVPAFGGQRWIALAQCYMVAIWICAASAPNAATRIGKSDWTAPGPMGKQSCYRWWLCSGTPGGPQLQVDCAGRGDQRPPR